MWEQGLGRSSLQQGLIMLAATNPDIALHEVAKLTIGERDRRLLDLRERLFGSNLVNVVACPNCNVRVEWNNRIADVLAPAQEQARQTAQGNSFKFEKDSYSIRFRLPTSLDVVSVSDDVNLENAAYNLCTRCVLSAEYDGEDCPVEVIPASVIELIGEQMELLDPQAEIRMDLICPDCAHSWEVLFDIASFLWTEFNDWAERTLHTIHRLARAYGWSEQDILKLSPLRRRLYLGMVGA